MECKEVSMIHGASYGQGQKTLENKRPMSHIAHLSHLGQYWKIFPLYMHFIFFCGHYTIRKGGHCLWIPQAYSCDIGVGILTILEIIGRFLFMRRRPWNHFVWSWPIPSDASWHKIHEYWLIIYCLRPAPEFFTYLETSPLPVKGCRI
jgi:hypothetical protein